MWLEIEELDGEETQPQDGKDNCFGMSWKSLSERILSQATIDLRPESGGVPTEEEK